MTKTREELREEARLAWDAAYEAAGSALDAWKAAGCPQHGAEADAWRAACKESQRTSDIYMNMMPRVLPDIPPPKAEPA